MANELLVGRLSGRGSAVGGARRASGRARTRGRGGPCSPVRESRCDREPVRPGRPNPHRRGARAGRATSGARSVAAVPLPAPSASGRSAEGVGRTLQPPPAALPQPGEECATSCSSPLSSAAPRSEELGARGDKGCS